MSTAGLEGFSEESSVHVVQRHPDLQPGETDTGSPVTLENFITFCIEKEAVDRYLVVLAGHGAGVQQDFLLKDDTPGGSLTIAEFKEVFQFIENKKQKIKHAADRGPGQPLIDILGMDSCLMSMAEICYEL